MCPRRPARTVDTHHHRAKVPRGERCSRRARHVPQSRWPSRRGPRSRRRAPARAWPTSSRRRRAAPAQATAAAQQATTRVVEVRAGGFDWADAGLGAAGALSVLGLGAGALVARVAPGRRSADAARAAPTAGGATFQRDRHPRRRQRRAGRRRAGRPVALSAWRHGAPAPARRASSRRSGSRPSCSPGARAAAPGRTPRPPRLRRKVARRASRSAHAGR